MDAKIITPHEVFELHEILTFKNVCATKSATMVSLVKDQELKDLLQEDVIASRGHIKELKDLIQDSTWKFEEDGHVNGARLSNIIEHEI